MDQGQELGGVESRPGRERHHRFLSRSFKPVRAGKGRTARQGSSYIGMEGRNLTATFEEGSELNVSSTRRPP